MTNKSPRPAGRRSDAQAAKTRARIVHRAERMFARYGYQGVPMRELARACGVRMFTIQHHFGSKLSLYREILARGDREVREVLQRIVTEETEPGRLVERIVDELFDFFLENRDWVALNHRAMLGEKLPGRGASADRGWVSFMDETIRARNLGLRGHDLGLLLLTVEGILNNHALATSRHRHLFGRDADEGAIATMTKAHLKKTILAILESGGVT